MQQLESNNKTERTILVTGATGKQGSAVARHLLKAGFRVRALTRNPNSKAAGAIARLGADLVIGDLNNKASLARAVENAYGVFSVQNYWEKGVGYAGEVQQGKHLADAAKQASVQHFVQSSMATGQYFEGIEHFESKAAIEDYIREIELPYTILGAVYFLDNMLDPKMGGSLTFPTLSGTLRPDLPFHVLAVDDLGGITANIFQNRARFLLQKIDIASDCLTVPEMKQRYREVTGKRPKFWSLPSGFLKLLNKEFAQQLSWQNKPGWTFDVTPVRRLYPELTLAEV